METADATTTGGLASAYGIILLVGGLLALGYSLWRAPQWRLLRRPPNSWQLRWLDFGLFIVALVLLALISGMVGTTVAFWIMSPAEGETVPLVVLHAVSGVLMHASFIAFFWQWREFHRRDSEGPLDAQPLPWGALIGRGLLLILAAYPVVLLTSLAWQSGLDALRTWGLPILPEEQLAVELFREREHAWALVLLAFTAIVLAPIGEELVFRGGVYRFLLGRIGKPNAMVFSSLLFGLIHGNLFGFVPLAVLGLLLVLAYDLTGNLKVPIVMHLVFNAHTVALLVFFPEAVPAP